MRHVEITVPGSPEEVWDAIATTEGNAAWAFPADVDEHTVTIHREPFGPDVTMNVTAKDRPHRFAYEGRGDQHPPLATEFLVDARDHGTCVVRVVTGFADAGEEWEDLLDGAIEGWRMTLLVLRAYLTHFKERPASTVHATVNTGRPAAEREEIAQRLFKRLGVAGLTAGDAFRTPDGPPPLSGTVEDASPGYVLLRTDDALFAISAFPMVDPEVSVNVTGHVFGSADIAQHEKDWNDWIRKDSYADLDG